MAMAAARRTPVSWALADRVLFVANTQNQRRTLDPIAGTPLRRQALPRPSAASYVAAIRAATDSLTFGDRPDAAATAARSLPRAEAALRRIRPAALVVATQHDAGIRAWLHAARQLGIPSIYFPHAPMAANAQYRDLPVDFAGLRGLLEVRAYEALGADATRMTVCGNPAVDGALGLAPRTERLIFALSPHPQERLRSGLAALSDAWDGHVTIAPHPRSDPSFVRRTASATGWAVAGIRTIDLLRAGAAGLAQDSSGVTWEALAQGIPVVQLGTPTTGTYEFIHDPSIIRLPADDPELDLRRTLARVDAVALQAVARRWCSTVGREAVLAARELIGEAVQRGPQDTPILDGWAVRRPVT